MSDSNAIPFYGLPIVGWKLFQLSHQNHLISLFKHDKQPWHILGEAKRAEDPKACCRAPLGRYEGMMLPTVGNVRRDNHDSPGEFCSCGFWSYNSPEAALEDQTVGSNFFGVLMDDSGLERIRYGYANVAYSYMQQRGVLALVQQYGRFYTNELSTRSERVHIAALCSEGGPTQDTLAQLAREMGVPLMSFTEMREFSEIAGIKV